MSNIRVLQTMALRKLDPFMVEKLLYDLGTSEVKDGPKSELLHNCLNPNHNDRHPSASYNVDSHQFHCFSCKVGGDVIKLVMMVKKLGYVDAVKWLASFAGIGPINEKDVLQNNLEWRKRAKQVEDAVEDLYLKPEVSLPHHFDDNWKNAKPEIKKYVKDRHLNPLILKHFGIGYCNEGWWEDRVIVPFIYWDKIIGFTARTIWKEDEYFEKFPDHDYYARYKHKATTPIEEFIYGLDSGYRPEDPVFVEGSFDCIRMRSYGINCYTTLSNNISEKQAELVKKYFTGTIHIMPDNDDGGKLMVEKFQEHLYHSYPLKICSYPKSIKDPDGLSKVEAKNSVSSAKPLIEMETKKRTIVASSVQRSNQSHQR